jgi:hypothetical protein
VRLTPGSSIEIAGTKRFIDTIDVHAGWNLFGSVSEPVPVSSITSVPGGLSASPVFGYDGGFFREDTLRPGRGYWIRLDQPGQLIIDTSPPPSGKSGIRISASADGPPPPPQGEGLPVKPAVPDRAALFPNYPNPFNPSTTIRFQTPADGEIRLEVYNAIGERIAVLVDGSHPGGYHSVAWNASLFPSGIYFVRMTAGTFHQTRNMLLVK